MIYYIYDGSFDGLLTAIYESYYRRENPVKIFAENDFQQNLFIPKVHIKTHKKKAERVYNSIREKVSRNALRNIFYAYLSELPNVGTWIYDYIKLGFKVKEDIDKYLSDKRVSKIHKIAQRVRHERHLILGLIRFKKLENNIYYSQIEPKYNIIGLVSPHFAKRFSDQYWIIHDVKRKIGSIYNKKEWIIKDISSIKEAIKYDKNELLYQKLWVEYFINIAIKDRINPKLQMKNMPKRYWGYLTEKAYNSKEGVRTCKL
ncbi:TIGR03915 family putative DNA repair protein [Thermohalobacter berrensis]|uniref:DUF4130 domain-containing protein n=1 Tax=Thermohalobacter berrensis TaxID=99594 RepID=A0A419TAY5_9FIRM|nr:TIGR03915 family putative DNA repair protein [Thermohalobacter berrensis]RKD34623.1 hypothetical protein BET03_02010 [Thermohalobacter berrensis]